MTEKTPEQIEAEAKAKRSKEVADELFDSITGHEEMGIAQHFGRTIADLAENDSSMFARSLVFVMLRRAGANEDDARTEAMNMGLRAVQAKFEEGWDDSGKSSAGDEPTDLPPVTSLRSAL